MGVQSKCQPKTNFHLLIVKGSVKMEILNISAYPVAKNHNNFKVSAKIIGT